MNFRSLALTAAVLLLSSSLGFTLASTSSKEDPFVLISDDLDYNEQTKTVVAEGKVYVSHDHQLLYADTLRYDQQNDTIYAEGNVWLRDKDGIFSFCDYAELKNKFDDGFVNNIKMLLVDNSRMAAIKGQRFHGQKTILWNGVYSPCHVCKKQPNSPPLWQLRANKVIHDSAKKELVYHNLFMDFWGIPVFYTPYFFHPDPSVKRKTGLLTPTFGSSGDFGFIFAQPFFWDISPNSDLTLYPIYTSKEGPIIGGEYRHLYSSADMRINASFTGDSHNHNAQANNPNAYRVPGKHRWHAFFDTRVEVTPDVLFTAKIRRASDLTYLRRYPITIGNTSPIELQTALTSTLALERFKDTSYGVVRSYVFQADNPKVVPYIYPVIDYNFETMPGDLGETYGFNVNMLNLSRQSSIPGQVARKMSRGSLDLYGQVPYVSNWGDVWQLKARMRGDIYTINGYQVTPTDDPYHEFRRRLFPQVSLNWRYPLVKFFDSSQWILEPAAMIVTGTQAGNSIDIPNEDTPFVTLDTTNLYMMNRFYGVDRVDTGNRAVYGFHSRNYFRDQKHIFLFLGQIQRLDHKTALPYSSGEDNDGSGIVGKIDFKPHQLIQLQSRFITGKKQFRFDVAESSVGLNFNYLTLNVSHIYYGSRYSTSKKTSSQMNWGITTARYKDVTLTYGEIRNLRPEVNDVRVLSRSVMLAHENECLKTTLSVVRLGYSDRDLRPDTRVMLQLTFKNLGTVMPLNINGFQN
ncbi:LPS-assembly protein LptD [Candidatus Paracaedibacter symbiosus]|uniref:LPS-assembly protein LptD n=1 Tax=Candidatus Paracaedibacter symbiosus TaxID=244582 RepID=UPI000509FBF8|nr:LPS assembly protein LptD [Candidatus Paracaedibacter symbiosus]